MKMGRCLAVVEAAVLGQQFYCSALLARCQLDLRLTIPGAARVVDLRACTPITHSRR